MSTSKSPRPRKAARPGPRSSYHHGDLRRALINTALELVQAHGADGFTLREAARRIGVSQTAPYRHFETKEALLAAVAEESFRELYDRLEARGNELLPDPLSRLRAQGITSFAFYIDNPARFRVMFGRISGDPQRYPGLLEAGNRVNNLLLESLLACQREGQIRGGDPMELGLAIGSMVHGLAMLILEGQLAGEISKEHALGAYEHARGVLFRGLHP